MSLRQCMVILLLIPIFAMASEKHSLSRSLQGKMDETGKLLLQFDTPKDKTLVTIKKTFEERGYYQQLVNILNNKFIFPTDITIKFAEEDGPLYDPNDKTITMSYDFILYVSGVYIKNYPKATTNDMIDFAEATTTFFLYHELAHALIDVWNIPVISNEETAADNLAVILALEYTKDGNAIVMDTARLFEMFEAEDNKYADDDLWDEHALDAQRFYNIICLTYGHNPKKIAQALKELDNKKLLQFIKQKGDYCESLYQQQLKSWIEVLDIHLLSD